MVLCNISFSMSEWKWTHQWPQTNCVASVLCSCFVLSLPEAVLSSSFSSLFSCRRVTSAFRIPSLSFSSSCFSFKYRLASSSARVFPYLPYWLASERGCQRRAKVRCQMCRGYGKTMKQLTAIFLPVISSHHRDHASNATKHGISFCSDWNRE